MIAYLDVSGFSPAAAAFLSTFALTGQAFTQRVQPIQSSGDIAIVNYGIIALIQLELGHSDKEDISAEKAIELYDKYLTETTTLMLAKNHDYGEAWRSMRISSYTDIILTKLNRTKQIEDNEGKTLVSEGVDANYMDMINYSIFALIKLEYGE